MKRREPDDTLHDYLDGRLSDAAREEFERRLMDDASLRERLDAYRAIRGALREDPTELPPGFHARARARFERSRPARRPWFRPLSWESLGVAAAALLVAALFLPEWISGGGPAVRDVESSAPLAAKPGAGPAQEAPRGETQTLAEPDAVNYRAAPAAPVDPDSASESGQVGPHDVAADRLRALGYVGKNEEAPVEESVREDEARRKSRVEGEAAPPVPLEPFRDEADEQVARTDDVSGGAGTEAAAPSAALEQRKGPSPEGRPAGYEEEAKKSDLEESRARQQPAALSMGGRSVALAGRPTGLPLPGGLADPGTVRVIADAEAWSALPGTGDGGPLAGLAPAWERERVVLVGPRGTPVACSEVRVVAGERLRLVLTAGQEPAGSDTGCAVLVPAGNEPVVVEGP